MCDVVYARKHLIIGRAPEPVKPLVLCHGKHSLIDDGDLQIHDTLDGDCTALLVRDDRFALAFGHTPDEVSTLAEEGLSLCIETELEKKKSLYKRFSLAPSHPYAKLYAKCLSTMKTQLYSPEGNFSHRWSTPDRLPHRGLWLWDSVFHAIGFRNVDPALSQELILAVLDCQKEDGFIPYYANWVKTGSITQPPVIAWGAWKVYELSHDRAFLESVFNCNKRFLSWVHENRRQTDKMLYTWHTNAAAHNRCDESGMDNSPRFDTDDPLLAIDFSCFMANEARFMAKIALELGQSDQAKTWESRFQQIKEDINRVLWSKEDGFYFDFNIAKKQLHKVWAVSSFLPLFAGVCTQEQSKQLICRLLDPEHFGTPFPIPSISRSDPHYGSDMWRGPVWINYNYMIVEGLTNYGFLDLAQEIIDKTLSQLNRLYERSGSIFEFYDSEAQRAPWELNRKGPPFEPHDFEVSMQAVRDFGWSNTLTFDLLSREKE